MTTVLIADDNPRVRVLLRTVLRDAGYAVVEAEDGDAALIGIRDHRPAVIILDVVMPGHSGLEICRLVRADPELAAIRVILISANATEEETTTAGADAFLPKPFSPLRLLAFVGDLAARTLAIPDARPLGELRAERQLTIRDLARLAGVRRDLLVAIEAGERAPSTRVIRHVSAALGIDPSDIVEFHPVARTVIEDRSDQKAAARLREMGYPAMLALRAATRHT